jgi:hypothetical protein
MSMTQIISRAGKFLSDNSPVIFTAIGVTGALTTAYLTGKASFKAAQVIAEAEVDGARRVWTEPVNPGDPEPDRSLSTKEKVDLVWKLYIPAVGSGVLTVISIIAASQIGTRRAAAMTTAYKLSQKAWDEYKEKVVEKLGVNKEQKIHDQLAQDQVDKHPVGSQQIIITNDGGVLCFDAYTGRYFHSSMETLKRAQNELNRSVLENYYASLTDFYHLIGLPKTTFSDDVGWNVDKTLELVFSATISENEIPCIHITYTTDPIRGYDRLQ